MLGTADDNTQLHLIEYQQQPSTQAAGRSLALGPNNKQSKAPAVGLVRIHGCLSPPNKLRRNIRGLPSATATYTALKKAAAGGSLIPVPYQSAHNRQHVPQTTQQRQAPMQSLRQTRPTVTCLPSVSYEATHSAVYALPNMCGGCITCGCKPLLVNYTRVLAPDVSSSDHCLCL